MLQVPDRFVKTLEKLHKLSDESSPELLAALARIPLSSSRDQLSDETHNLVSSIKQKELEEILSLLISLKSAQQQAEESSDFVGEVLVAMSRSDGNLEVSGSDRDKFKKRLLDLLEASRFSISAKAIGLIGESEHTFCRARILTDFRPIYGDDPSKKPVAGLITHTLRLSYHEGSQLQHIYVLLDDSDLNEMKAVLSRANEKGESLRTLLAATHVPLIGTNKKVS